MRVLTRWLVVDHNRMVSASVLVSVSMIGEVRRRIGVLEAILLAAWGKVVAFRGGIRRMRDQKKRACRIKLGRQKPSKRQASLADFLAAPVPC